MILWNKTNFEFLTWNAKPKAICALGFRLKNNKGKCLPVMHSLKNIVCEIWWELQKRKQTKNAQCIFCLREISIFYFISPFFCPIRSGAPMKSGLVHISPVHVLDKAILSHLWITKIHINCIIILDNQLIIFRKIGSGSVHVLIQVHKKWTNGTISKRANRILIILFVLGCYKSLECLELWVMNGFFLTIYIRCTVW